MADEVATLCIDEAPMLTVAGTGVIEPSDTLVMVLSLVVVLEAGMEKLGSERTLLVGMGLL